MGMTSRTLLLSAQKIPLIVTTVAFLVGWFAPSPVLAAPAKVDIPAQPAISALQLFIKQTAVQVAYAPDEMKNISVNAVTGEHEPAVALELLLKDTGLTLSRRDSGWYVVSTQGALRAGSIEGFVQEARSSRPVAGARVLLAGTTQSALTDKRGRFSLDSVVPGDHTLMVLAEGMQDTKVTDVAVKAGHRLSLSAIGIPVKQEGPLKLEPYTVSAKKNEGIVELDPFAVEGRREKPFVRGNMDIPRTLNDTQPYYIFNEKAITQSGAINVEEFLKQQLTMNTTALTAGQDVKSVLGNTSSINLRGVGIDKTLILVNGRRMPGVVVEATSYQPDLNGIPLSAIERIEVLPSSASGIYGGSAIGGVLNIILKNDYQGGEIRTTYDNTWDTDSPRRNVSLSYGLALEGGKTHVSFNAAWSDTEPLLMQDRLSIFKNHIAGVLSRSPNFAYSSATSSAWLGALPNIMPTSASVPTLTLDNGTVLNSRFTYVPAGTSSATSATQLATALLANAGQWNSEFPTSTQSPTGLLRRLESSLETKAFRVNIRRQMMAWLEAFADLTYNENRTISFYSPFDTSLNISATSPINPFTTAVRVRVPDSTQARATTNSQSRSVTAGVMASMPGGWTGAMDYTWSENRFDYQHVSNDTLAWLADIASGVLNPFVDTLHYPFNFSKYAIPGSYGGSTRLHDVTLRGSGPLPAFPWGIPNLTFGLEHRLAQTPERSIQYDFPITQADSNRLTYYSRESVTDSGYAETTVPLIKEDWMFGIHSLGMQLAGRSERYKVDNGTSYIQTQFNRTPPVVSYGSPTLNGKPYFSKASYTSTNYTIGLKYQPVKEVTLRVSRATAFLPPLPSQLLKNPLPNPSLTTITDQKTGGRYGVQVVAGGNPDLKPQNSKSLNAGLIWVPTWKGLEGFRLNAEYYKIEQFDAIGNQSAQLIVNQESLYGNRITRDASGTITLVDASSLNLYHRVTEGWDFSMNYTRGTAMGTFSLSTIGSIITKLKSQYSPSLPEYDAAGFSPVEGGAAKYKGNATLTWDWHNWTAGWTTRYFSDYKQYGAKGGPFSLQNAGGGEFGTYILEQGSDTIPSQMYHDVFVGYTFGQSPIGGEKRRAFRSKLLDGLTVQLGIGNVFKKVPPLDVYYNYLSLYGDIRLRSYRLSLKKAF